MTRNLFEISRRVESEKETGRKKGGKRSIEPFEGGEKKGESSKRALRFADLDEEIARELTIARESATIFARH